MTQIPLALAVTILIGVNAMGRTLTRTASTTHGRRNGYNTLSYTCIVHVNTVGGNDAIGDGLAAETALKTLGAGAEFHEGRGNVILVAPGICSGSANLELDFNGRDIWLRASGNLILALLP